MDNKKRKEEGKANNSGVFLLIFLVLLLVVSLLGAYYYFNLREEGESVNTNIPLKESSYTIKNNDVSDFDLYFMKLNNSEANKVYSPLSIKYALEMLSEGAKGDTKAQIDSILGKYSNKKYINSDNMSFANAMFIKNTFKDSVNSKYTDNLKSKYNADVIYDDFTSPNNINKWVSNKTFNLINNLLNDVSNNDFILVNALAINMEWNKKIQATSETYKDLYNVNYKHEKFNDYVELYDSEYNKDLKFNNNSNVQNVELASNANRYDIVKSLGEDNIRSFITEEYNKWLTTDDAKYTLAEDPSVSDVSTNVEKYIKELKENYGKHSASTDFSFYTDDEVKVFAKDLKTYNGTTLQYVGIMPNELSLKDYISKLDSKKVSNLIKKLKDSSEIDSYEDGKVTKVHGNLPLFNYEYTLNLDDSLKKLGITDIYDINKSNLSNMLNGDKKDAIETIHKANIDFSNDGIKAAAKTAVGGLGSAGPNYFEYLYDVPTVEINLDFDKPYLYLIRDKESGEVWFAGTVYEPTLNQTQN